MLNCSHNQILIFQIHDRSWVFCLRSEYFLFFSENPLYISLAFLYLSCLFFLRIFLVQLSAGQYNCGKSTFSWIGEMLASILIKCIHHTRDSPYKLHWPRITSTKIEQREPHWNKEKGIGYMARTFERHCTKTRWYPSENLLTLFTTNQEIFGTWELVFPL